MGEELPQGERLQKVLARAGIGSRRTCEGFISAGRVSVNGETAVLGRRVDPDHDGVALDGVPVIVRDDLVYYLLNKPRGVLTTVDDPHGRSTVMEFLPSEPRVFPVGRLDYDSEGLLILTNDGDLTYRLTHPSFGVSKVYLAEVEGVPTRATLRTLREGVELEDGWTAPARARIVQIHGDTSAIELVIHEGRKRQVRRMCEAVDHPVIRLVRTSIGSLGDRSLAPGSWRRLEPREVRQLYASSNPAPEATGTPARPIPTPEPE